MMKQSNFSTLRDNASASVVEMWILRGVGISAMISRVQFFDGRSDGIRRIANKKMRPFQYDKSSINHRVGVREKAMIGG